MRATLLGALVLLAACRTETVVPEDDLAAIRKDLETLKRLPPYALEAEDLMDAVEALRRDVRALAARPVPEPPLPPARFAQAGELIAGGDGPRFWVLSTIEVDGVARTVLCLYQAHEKGFVLAGARQLDYDFRLIEYNAGAPGPSVKDLRGFLDRK